MEDDKLINDLTVTTDRLLTPQRNDESVHDVLLVIHVKTIILSTFSSMSFNGSPQV